MNGLLLTLVLGLQAASAASPPVGTAQITGVVVSADADAAPVRRAIVTISGGGSAQAVSTVTDDAGRFAFTGLIAGRYTLAARKPAYLPTVYGAPAPGKPGTPVLVTTGGRADVRVPIVRGAVISGTVRDALGNPVSAVPVYAVPARSGPEPPRLALNAIHTDDRGAFRIFGLAPGEYLVLVAPRSTTGSELLALGRAEVDARLRALEQRHGAGVGSAGLSAPAVSSAAAASTADRPAPQSFAPIFYPGTPIAARAGRVRAGAGEERTAVDIMYAPVPVVTVSGTIQQTGGIEVTRIRPELTVVGVPQSPLSSGPSLVGPAADGSFSFTNVTPGRYTLVVRTGQGASMSLPGGNGFTSTNPGVAALFAMTEFEVDGRDISGLTFALQPLPSLSGRVEFSGAGKPPANMSQVSVVAQVLPGASSTTASDRELVDLELTGRSTARSVRATVAADGSFAVEGLIPGTYAFTVGMNVATPSPWRPRSLMVDGRDLLDAPVDIKFGTADMTAAVLTFTDARAELAGTLTVPADQTADRYAIVVFTVDRALWREGARRLRTIRPAPDGAFSIMDLPAGEYFLAAVDNAPPDDWQQASFLEQLAAASVKVTIRDGEKTLQSLRIAR